MKYLTIQMRDVLIEHIDGRVPFRLRGQRARNRVIQALLDRGLLGTERDVRPRWTYLTGPGRSAVARLLADCADALVRAGYGAQSIAELATGIDAGPVWQIRPRNNFPNLGLDSRSKGRNLGDAPGGQRPPIGAENAETSPGDCRLP